MIHKTPGFLGVFMLALFASGFVSADSGIPSIPPQIVQDQVPIPTYATTDSHYRSTSLNRDFKKECENLGKIIELAMRKSAASLDGTNPEDFSVALYYLETSVAVGETNSVPARKTYGREYQCIPTLKSGSDKYGFGPLMTETTQEGEDDCDRQAMALSSSQSVAWIKESSVTFGAPGMGPDCTISTISFLRK